MLRELDFVFFSDLFEAANEETTFLFTEVTPRIWPEIVDVILRRPDGGEGFQVGFPKLTKRAKGGNQLVIQKKRGASISRDAISLCDSFPLLNELHNSKIEKGFERQPRKIRGSKILNATCRLVDGER